MAPAAPVAGGFGPRATEKLGWYVYLLVDPRSGRPFLVDRGRGDRCFDHLRAARTGQVQGDHRDRGDQGNEGDKGGSDGFAALDRIRSIERAGRQVRIDVLRHGLDGAGASVVVAAVADALGLPNRSKAASQRITADEVDAALAKRARFKRSHPAVLLRVTGCGPAPDYEQVRHGWRIGQRWTDPAGPRSPRWAVVVDGELVVDVYRLARWDPTPRAGVTTRAPSRPGVLVERYSFVGERDDELARRYVGRSVGGRFGAAGGAGPVGYVWCGPNWVPPDG